jgi:hypothetical protein
MIDIQGDGGAITHHPSILFHKSQAQGPGPAQQGPGQASQFECRVMTGRILHKIKSRPCIVVSAVIGLLKIGSGQHYQIVPVAVQSHSAFSLCACMCMCSASVHVIQVCQIFGQINHQNRRPRAGTFEKINPLTKTQLRCLYI